MKNKIKSNSLIKDVFTVASGTMIAQIIGILLTPVITRMYGPTAYGVLGVFMSAVSIIGNTAALSYPQAIVLPKNKEDSRSVVRVSISVSFIIALLLLVIIMLYGEFFVDIFNIQPIEDYLLLLPLVVVLTGTIQSFQQLNIREKKYKVIAFATIAYTLVKNFSKVLLGYILPSATILILVSTFSLVIQAILLIQKGGFKREFLRLFKVKLDMNDLSIAKIYKDFPLYRAPQTLFNSMSQNLPVILFSIFFGPTTAGYYTLSKSVLTIPIGLISKSVGDALYPRLSENYNNGITIKSTLIKSTVTLSLLGLVPFGIIIIFGPTLFEIIFGASWNMAGEFARWMSFILFFMFINRPIVTAIPILKIQKEYLIFEISSTIIKIAGLLIGIYIYKSSLVAVASYSLLGSLFYLVLIIKVIMKAQ